MRETALTAEEEQQVKDYYFGAYLRWMKFHPLADDLASLPQVRRLIPLTTPPPIWYAIVCVHDLTSLPDAHVLHARVPPPACYGNARWVLADVRCAGKGTWCGIAAGEHVGRPRHL